MRKKSSYWDRIRNPRWEVTNPASEITQHLTSLNPFCQEQDIFTSNAIAVANGTAGHARGWVIKRLQAKPYVRRNVRKKIGAKNLGHERAAKTWIVTSPQGQSFTVRNLYKFCRARGLNQSLMVKVASGVGRWGKPYHAHKGWGCKRAAGNVYKPRVRKTLGKAPEQFSVGFASGGVKQN